ncbi:hypothetical protein [Aestuariivirga sp.]|uniref:hypothetical protein n=1 Tax=Aestuariivirga sp. TaxID=2650926 RepID=UPI0039E2B534
MILDPLLDLFRGRAITIPPMDGALKPNTLLDEADALRAAEAPDSLAVRGDQVLYCSGNEVRSLATGAVIASFPAAITALAVSASGALAAGLESGAVLLDGTEVQGFNCPVAMAFGGDGALYVCNGSADLAPSQWATDLMRRNAGGSVWRVDPKTRARSSLATGLAFPFGIAVDEAQQRLIVSESWHYRIIAIPLGGGKPQALLSTLPGYPARLMPSGDGYVLALFAPRNRLIEFVLREDHYRMDMMAEIDSRYWIAPSLSASHSFLEPLQNGGVRTMGIHKPWSPSRSYGLVVELDSALQPLASYHSRANGTRHGVTSAIRHEGRIIAASRGGNVILGLEPQGGGA